MSNTPIFPEPIWAIEVPAGEDWPLIEPSDIRDYTKDAFSQPKQRYHDSGLAKLQKYGLPIPAGSRQ